MNKLEEEFKDSIYLNGSKDDGKYFLTLSQLEQVGKESVQITTDVAIKFAEWVRILPPAPFGDDRYVGNISTKELFQVFINEHYGK
jgi:hypothetical protein